MGNLGERFLGGRSGSCLRAELPQEFGQHFARIMLVVHDQYRDTFELQWARYDLTSSISGECRFGISDWQPHREGGALTLTGARGFDFARVEFDQVTHDRQAQAEAAVRARAAAVGLAEPVEHVG